MESRQTREPDIEIELTVPLDTVCQIILKAREFDVKAGSSDPAAGEIDDDDLTAAVLEDRPSDPVEIELRHVIDDLPNEAQADLVALMWLGREDGSVQDWASLHETALDEHNRNTAGYLIGTPLLADHLENGLDAIGLSCTEFEETTV